MMRTHDSGPTCQLFRHQGTPRQYRGTSLAPFQRWGPHPAPVADTTGFAEQGRGVPSGWHRDSREKPHFRTLISGMIAC